MKNKLLFIHICFFTLLVFTCKAQQFLNGGLEGTFTVESTLPPHWQNVPATDVNCQATTAIAGRDSPDLTDTTGPLAGAGIMGNPYSGVTFVSGLYGGFAGDFFQEGIMQTVSGFEVATTYTISFYQSVVKQLNANDESGAWAVYIDTVLAGITTPTYSTANYNSISFIWELRNIVFTATATSHLIKFLPVDDDANTSLNSFDALRMGIDAISLTDPNAIIVNAPLLIPNVFTPNNDGLNDVFKITIPNSVTFNCKIYNRWGVLVNELATINEAWDGNTTGGLQCTEGVYYWTAEYSDAGGKKARKGFIQLLR